MNFINSTLIAFFSVVAWSLACLLYFALFADTLSAWTGDRIAYFFVPVLASLTGGASLGYILSKPNTLVRAVVFWISVFLGSFVLSVAVIDYLVGLSYSSQRNY